MLGLKKSVHKPGHFPVHHKKGETIFLSMGQKIRLPQFSVCFHLLVIFLSVRDSVKYY